ncbi:hypothetical protein PsorP6_012919 [Peronosclerospora sorghi]|uniref:Uncharacterized protein n=1 Tax=Peronosclerospora sorghi TaxID=230839 RepID=A0ACC0WII7_9STRA|nr:hypothetical protein PsorP6_012919 [Peronosclerospora sorghi]
MHRFQELECIGHGSFGSAYLVHERACPEHKFVIKKIPMQLLSAKEKDQAFHEVELLAKLDHPNVVAYKESFVLDNVLHIVMAYCDGGDLAEKIQTQQQIQKARRLDATKSPRASDGYFPITQVLDWFVQMTLAIKYLHDQRVLHRDLKTSNVFLTTANVIKLGDFGIAKTLNSTLDQAKTMVGTPYYMSPEVCESKPYSYASDMWSLGCILYELLTLRHAFEAPNLLTLIVKIVQQGYAPIPSHYDKHVATLLGQLLEKNPDKRPSMDELVAMPYLRQHMQKLVASRGTSLKVQVVSPATSTLVMGRRCFYPTNVATPRASSRQLRRPPSFLQGAPSEWLALQTFSKDVEDPASRHELEVLETTRSAELTLSLLRFPERSTTPEPLTEEKARNRLVSDGKVVRRKHLDKKKQRSAWGKSETRKDQPHASACQSQEMSDEDEESRFQMETEASMNPNFQREYSHECFDSWHRYDRSQDVEASCDPPGRKMLSLRLRRGRRMHVGTPWVNSSGSARQEKEEARGKNEKVDSDGTRRAPSLSESFMMQELERDAQSDEDMGSDDTSLSAYEAEENFYSDESSDFFDQSGNQDSDDDFEHPEADVIEYMDEECVTNMRLRTQMKWKTGMVIKKKGAQGESSEVESVLNFEGPAEVAGAQSRLTQYTDRIIV